MDAKYMRLHVINEYPGDSWREKVLKMPDNQVIAIYNNILRRKAKKDILNEQQSADGMVYHQINMYEFCRENNKEL